MKRIFSFLCFALLLLSAKAATITVNSDITSNTTWTNNNIYVLTSGFIYVTNNATLTIQAGTIVKGTAASLVITRGAKIMAIGTPTQPIVFTSSQPAGSRNSADWGGVLLLGYAPINDPAGTRTAEGGIDPVKGLYGGTNPADNSGTMQYCRIEYAGIAYQPNNETNGLTMGGVGSGTVIDHIQISHGGDDSFEWFGGTVTAKYLVAYRGLDDDFDTDYGFSGKVQFGVGLRDSAVADVSGSNGFESDNDAGGTTNLPNTNATFSNMTLYGPKTVNASTAYNSNYKRGAHLRRSTQQDIYNTVITGWPVGLKIEGTNTAANVTSGALQFKNNILAGMGQLLDSSALSFGMGSWYNNVANGNTTLANPQDIMTTSPYNYNAPNFMPLSGSPVLVGADFSAANLQDPFFTPVNYRGAFGTDNWTTCWTEFNPQTQAYTSAINYLTTPTITYTGATTFCNGLTKTLTAPAGFASYLWSNGATTQSIVVSTSGSYTVTVSNTRGCVATSAPVVITVTPGPDANVAISGATTFCTGNSALLTGSSTITGVSYQWLNNGANVSGATTPYYNATTSGVYSLKVTKSGCVGNSTATTITVNTLPTATISGTLTVCNGAATTLTAPTGTGLSYQWYQGGSPIAGATANTYAATTGGSYTVEVTNANNCSATSAAASVVATSFSVVLTANNNAVICGSNPVTLTATNVSGATYEWYKNGQLQSGATTNSISTSISGGYYAKVTKSGCAINSNSIGTSIQAIPSITASATSVCSGVAAYLTASSGSSYLWYNNNVAIATATNANYSTLLAGSFTVKVGSCTSAPTVITVNALPTATITAAGPTSFCLGNDVTLNANTGTGLAYQWRKSNAAIAGATNSSYVANTGGSYTVKVTNTATGCTKVSTATTVTANTVPATPVITRSGNVFTSSIATGNQWYKNGAIISGATANTYTATTTGCYNTIVTNTSGCTATSDTLCKASLTQDGENGGEMARKENTIAGLSVNVLPNPNNGNFDLAIQNESADTETQVAIINLMGQVVFAENIVLQNGETRKEIRLDNVANGVYFVRIQIGEKLYEHKLVINK